MREMGTAHAWVVPAPWVVAGVKMGQKFLVGSIRSPTDGSGRSHNVELEPQEPDFLQNKIIKNGWEQTNHAPKQTARRDAVGGFGFGFDFSGKSKKKKKICPNLVICLLLK